MTIREIVTFPAPILRQKTGRVDAFDGKLHELLDDMAMTMYAANGVGLAAPQVNVPLRVAVIDVSEDRAGLLELVNPEILTRAGEVPSEEGCLSIPDYRETITRSKEISLRYQDRNGAAHEISADELLAICAQHEIDHLDGILFIDHMSRLKREIFNKWLKKRGGMTGR